MTAASGVPPWARPVLEALREYARMEYATAELGSQAEELCDALSDACTAALPSDAGTPEGERCLRCAHLPDCHGHGCDAVGPICEAHTTDPTAPPMDTHAVCCHDCGLAYGSDGWMDAHLPDDIWARITLDGAAILCVGCMARRCLRLGLSAHIQFGSGPFATGKPYESGAAAPPTNAPETSTSLVGTAPDAELDRLLIEYARCQVQARYASRSQPEINRRAYAVDYAAAAIHAHVERVKREAREHGMMLERGRLAKAGYTVPHEEAMRVVDAMIPVDLVRREKEDA